MLPVGAKVVFLELDVLDSQVVSIPQIVKLLGVSYVEGRARPQLNCIVIDGTKPRLRRILTFTAVQGCDLGQYLGTYYLRRGNPRHVYLAD